MFPLPAVPDPRPSSAHSRRLQQRARRAAVETRLANGAIEALNALSMSSTNTTRTQTRNAPNTYPARSLRAVAHVQACAKRYVSRLAPSCENSSDDSYMLRDTQDLFTASYSYTTDALRLSADRVALPSEPGTADLLDILPPDLARRYEHFDEALFRPVDEREPAPSVLLVESNDEYLKLIRRMYSLEMVRFTTEPVVVNGLFGTAKSDGMIRLVFDGRPVNAWFVASPAMELPTPDLLARLHCEPGETIYVAKADLDNFYHRIRMPSWMHPYFALPAVRAGDVGADGFAPDTLVYPCCTTMPMGFSHAATLAQKGHEHQVASRTSLLAVDRVTRSSDFSLARPRHGIYIDDFFQLGTSAFLDVMRARLAEYVAAMDSIFLPVKRSKLVAPSADGVVVIGVEVHGRERTVGVLPSSLDALVRRTQTVLAAGKCTGRAMSSLVGHWTWAMLPRRPTLAIFSAVYRFIEVAGMKLFDIWKGVRGELSTVMALVPLLSARMDAPWFPRTIATDASEFGQGVVAAYAQEAALCHMSLSVPPLVAESLPSQRQDLLSAESEVEGVVVDRSLHPALSVLRWATIVASPWLFPEHINVLELRALTTGLRWMSSFPSAVGCRLVLWCDSLVCVFAVRKGRSSSRDLLARLRVVAAYALALGVQLYCNWIPTELNPADEPSRRYGPAASPPFVSPGVYRPRFDFDATLGYPGEGPRQTFLLKAVHAESTRKKYEDAVAKFVSWMSSSGFQCYDWSELDAALTEYFHDLYTEKAGACRSRAEATVSGLVALMPAVKPYLLESRLALRGWRRLVPPVAYPPMTWDLAVCVAVRMAATGHWSSGVGVLLSFECYLRIGELAGLRRKDVADVGDPRLGSVYGGMALRLRRTKTGNNKWVAVRSVVVRQLVRMLLRRAPPGRRARLFPSPAVFRRRFKDACAFLGLSSDFVPHSLRHGGATHDHLLGRPLEEILQHGRWASTKSARHYVQAGRALLMTMNIPDHVATIAEIFVPSVMEVFVSLSQSH